MTKLPARVSLEIAPLCPATLDNHPTELANVIATRTQLTGLVVEPDAALGGPPGVPRGHVAAAPAGERAAPARARDGDDGEVGERGRRGGRAHVDLRHCGNRLLLPLLPKVVVPRRPGRPRPAVALRAGALGYDVRDLSFRLINRVCHLLRESAL